MHRHNHHSRNKRRAFYPVPFFLKKFFLKSVEKKQLFTKKLKNNKRRPSEAVGSAPYVYDHAAGPPLDRDRCPVQIKTGRPHLTAPLKKPVYFSA